MRQNASTRHPYLDRIDIISVRPAQANVDDLAIGGLGQNLEGLFQWNDLATANSVSGTAAADVVIIVMSATSSPTLAAIIATVIVTVVAVPVAVATVRIAAIAATILG